MMAARLATLIAHDARLQTRYGIYAAYSVVIAMYAGILWFTGPLLPRWVVAFTILSDPAVLGFFFLGGLMLLEKAVSAADYLASKTITLTAFALLAVTVLGLLAGGAVNWPLYLATVTLTSIQFIGIGAVFALRFRTVTGYLIGSGIYMLPFVGPGGFALLDPMPVALAVLPFAAPVRLMLVAMDGGTAQGWEIAVMLAILAAYAAAGFAWGVVALKKELGDK
jgi:fluoroquinolone transport system permease protein